MNHNYTYSIKIQLLILVLVIYSCNSIKQEKANDGENHYLISKKQDKNLVSLEIRIPYETSCYFDNKETFDVFNNKGKTIASEFDTITKTGRMIVYSLKKDTYNYLIKTPFNESVNKEIEINRDTSFYFYSSCYKKIKKVLFNDLSKSKKINILVDYDICGENYEIEILKKKRQYFIKFKDKKNWTNEFTINDSQIIKIIKNFESDIYRLHKNKVFDEHNIYYMNASKVFIKYDNNLFEVDNILNDSLVKVSNKLKYQIHKYYREQK